MPVYCIQAIRICALYDMKRRGHSVHISCTEVLHTLLIPYTKMFIHILPRFLIYYFLLFECFSGKDIFSTQNKYNLMWLRVLFFIEIDKQIRKVHISCTHALNKDILQFYWQFMWFWQSDAYWCNFEFARR